VLGDADMAEIVRDNRADLMVKICAQVNQEGGNLGIAAVDVRIRRVRSVTLDFGNFSRMQSERAREAQLTAMSSYFMATRSAKLIRRGTKAMRKETAFLPRPMAGPGFLAFYRSMQAYKTGS
jgi:modulator of FtsH protease HflC